MGPVESRDVAGVLSSIGTIIREAATSQLGILALLIVLAGAAGLIFFYKENVRYRLAVFIALVAGAAMFGVQVIYAQQELTTTNLRVAQEKRRTFLEDSLMQARQKPTVGEFGVRLQFPKSAPMPDAVETFIQELGQKGFIPIDSERFQRSDDPASKSVAMTYLQVPARAVLKIMASGGGRRWGTNDIRVPETILQMTQR